jgi:hypothetical protein
MKNKKLIGYMALVVALTVLIFLFIYEVLKLSGFSTWIQKGGEYETLCSTQNKPNICDIYQDPFLVFMFSGLLITPLVYIPAGALILKYLKNRYMLFLVCILAAVIHLVIPLYVLLNG